MAVDYDVDAELAAAGCPELTDAGIARSNRVYRTHTVQQSNIYVTHAVRQCLDDLSLGSVLAIARMAHATERQQDCLKRFILDMSQRRIAAEIGWSQSTVCVDLNTILARMAGAVDRYPWFGLAEILRELMTLESNWPRRGSE